MQFCFKKIFILTILLGLFGFFGSISANCLQARGVWQSINPKTNHPEAQITIWQSKNGLLFGKISKIFAVDGDKTTDRCVKCQGADYNKPILGLTIIKNMKPNGQQCTGGRITDTRSGKIYKAKLTPVKNGQQLKLRGYIGFSLFGQTRIWYRVKRG